MDLLGRCSNDGSSIVIGFEETSPGLGGGGGGGDNGFWEYGAGGAGSSGETPLSAWEREMLQINRCLDIWQAEIRTCVYEGDDERGEPAPVFEPITASDVAQFAPTPPQITVDPAGIAVMNLPTNFVAEVAEQVVDAVILGRQVAVRFTPTRFSFATGDGNVVTATHGGVSWAASASPQFTPTDTSHVYRERGLVYPSVTVTYAASIDLGAGWIDLGTVDASGPTQELRVYEALTRLVKNDP